MNFVNKLSSDELRKLFEIFAGTTNIIDFWIWTASDSIELLNIIINVVLVIIILFLIFIVLR